MDKDTNEIIETLQVILAKMGTKDDLAELRAAMATKDELNSLRSEMHDGFASIRTELRDIRTEIRQIHQRLDAIEAELRSHRGFAKEIDHLLERVGAIEKHLGIKHEITA
jgi:chromosome segregation ATPase